MSPQATAHNTALNSAVGSPRSQSRARSLASGLDRPRSMFEFRPSRDLGDVLPGRRSTRPVLGADADGLEDAEKEDAIRPSTYSNRYHQPRDGMLGDTEQQWEYGDSDEFGDDEGDVEEVQEVAAGLGISG